LYIDKLHKLCIERTRTTDIDRPLGHRLVKKLARQGFELSEVEKDRSRRSSSDTVAIVENQEGLSISLSRSYDLPPFATIPIVFNLFSMAVVSVSAVFVTKSMRVTNTTPRQQDATSRVSTIPKTGGVFSSTKS
jgi:hypothetical protein